MNVEFGRATDDYARFRPGFPASFFVRLVSLGVVRPAMDVLDLGTGTGTLARGFAKAGARVTAIDRSDAMLDAAARLDAAEGASVEYLRAEAERTGLPDRSFDLVSAGQCWHWFDRPRAAAEVRRLLRPGGRALIAHFDWLPHPVTVVEATERLILQHNPAWGRSGGTGFYPAWFGDLHESGFAQIESFSYDETLCFTHADWRGRIRASSGVGASLSAEAVTRFDEALQTMLRAEFPDEPLLAPHRGFAVIGRKPQEPKPMTGGV